MLPLSCCYDICHIGSGFLPGLTEGISEFIDGANVGSKLVPPSFNYCTSSYTFIVSLLYLVLIVS